MFISLLHLSRKRIQQIAEQNQNRFDEYTIHKLVYSLFPQKEDSERDFLFVVKNHQSDYINIIILSKKLPESTASLNIDTKELPASFLESNTYTFEILMNPVRCDSKTRKKIPLKGNDKIALETWFNEKAVTNGFEVISNSLSIESPSFMHFSKDGMKVTLNKVVFKGCLKVTNRQKFKNVFENGMGKGKAFGFGLLQITPQA